MKGRSWLQIFEDCIQMFMMVQRIISFSIIFFASKKCSIRNDFKRNAVFSCFVVPVKYLQVLSQLSARCTTTWMKSAEKQNLFHAYFHPISILKFSSIFWLFEKKNVHNVSLYTPNCQQTAQPSEQSVKITKIRFTHIFGKNK